MEHKQTTTELSPNVEAIIAYLIPVVTGVLMYVTRKDNEFIKFHAVQSILFWVAVIIAMSISAALIPVLIGLLIQPVVSFASFALWLFLMWKAYNNEKYMLPYLGKIAQDQIEGKFKTNG